MPKHTCSKKGKQPVRPKQGLDRWWIPPSPNPKSPNKQGVDTHLVEVTDKTPVTAGGLVIRQTSPCPCTLSPLVSPHVGEIVVSPVVDNNEEVVQRPCYPPVAMMPWPSSWEPQNTWWQARVIKEEVTDEEAGPSWLAPTSSHHVHYDQGTSPESEQQDSILGNPIAQSMAQHAFHVDTQFHLVTSITPSVNVSRFSHNTQSIQQVMHEHAEWVEACVQSAYKQNHMALDLISKSMDNVRSAFTEAKHTHDQFHDILSVSSQSHKNAWWHTVADAPSVHWAKREAVNRVCKVADYQCCLRSQVFVMERVLNDLQSYLYALMYT